LTPIFFNGLSVYADGVGTSNLIGQVGIEFYPLNTGDPELLAGYERRQNWASLRDGTRRYGMRFVRVTGCLPGTTYYYRLHAFPPNGPEEVWPKTGPLPAVRTTRDISFAATTKQLLLTIAGGDVPGCIGTLRSPTAAYPLAAVAGDGAGPNQFYFNLNELLSADGTANSLSPGEQTFQIELLGPVVQEPIQVVQLNIPAGFVMAQADELRITGLMDYLRLALGSTNLLAGAVSAVPIELVVRVRGLTNVNFTVELEQGRLTSLGIASLVPEIGAATIQAAGSNRFAFGLQAAAGQVLTGVRQVAQINFKAVEQEHSAIVSLRLQALEALNADGIIVTNLADKNGRVFVIAAEPILEAQNTTANDRALVLFGRPWTGYAIEYATNLAPGSIWTRLLRVPLSATFQVLEQIDTGHATVFYRAYQLPPSPPSLEIKMSDARLPYLILFGASGKSYQLQTAPALLAQTIWTPAEKVILTHSFQVLNPITNTVPARFYRLCEE
jgi:hypothetical protein